MTTATAKPRLKLKPTLECPPDKFRYVHPEDGFVTRSFSRDPWLTSIARHRAMNGYPPITPADAEDQLCRVLPPGWCTYEDGHPQDHFVETRLTVADIRRGTEVLASFVARGLPTVPQALIESRARTCASCYFNVPIAGCAPCLGLANLIASVAGNLTTPADPHLKSCAICKCANQAQTRLPIDLLAKGVTPDMAPLWPPFCWKGHELRALQNPAKAGESPTPL